MLTIVALCDQIASMEDSAIAHWLCNSTDEVHYGSQHDMAVEESKRLLLRRLSSPIHFESAIEGIPEDSAQNHTVRPDGRSGSIEIYQQIAVHYIATGCERRLPAAKHHHSCLIDSCPCSHSQPNAPLSSSNSTLSWKK